MEDKLEAIMEALCDLCYWPHVLEQEQLDTRCERCPAEKKLREMMERG